MSIVKLASVAVTGSLLAMALASPVFAASPVTTAFLANAEPNIDFLDRSSRLALDHSKAARLRDFAHGQAKDQTLAANVMDDWITADKATPVAEAAPAQTGELLTGRSVAIDGQTAPKTGPAADTRLALGQEDIDFLDGLTGREFDDAYKAKQRDALTQVQADYQTYIAQGDDPALLALAKGELPKINKQIVDLGKL